MQYLYNDAAVVTMNITNYDVHRMLIDNESSINVLFYEVLLKINIFLEWLERTYALITRFSWEPVLIKGTIMLLVIVGQAPK